MNTDEINSDEGDIFSRKKNFDILSKKLDIYNKEKFHLYKGNDLRYNNYIRKIQKLSMKESLDIEGYKDYIENLKNLADSKNKTFQGIAKIYLKDLLERENFSEILKPLNLEKEKFDVNKFDKSTLVSSSEKDSEKIINSLSNSFESIADKLFNLNENQKAQMKDNEIYKDLVNLRTAKLMIKLKLQIQHLNNIINSEDYLKEEVVYYIFTFKKNNF